MSGEPPHTSSPTFYEQLGGEAPLRAIVADFYDRVFDDVMIGFFFRNQDKARLVEREFEFAARALGAADVEYRGRTMRAAHAKHPIMRGQFDRRAKILEDTLRDHDVPEAVRLAWMGHTRALARAILGPAARSPHCDHDLQADRG